MSLLQKSESRFWLRSYEAWIIYFLAWLIFAAAFTAANLMSSNRSIFGAVYASLIVILPVALWGIGVIWVCGKISLPSLKKPWTVAIHLLFTFVFPVLWILTVMIISSFIKFFRDGEDFVCKLPPDHVFHWHLFAGAMIYLMLVSVTYTIDRIKRAERQRQETEVWVLRSQINPHFLFNTLHSLLALIRNQPILAEKSLEQFAGLMRYALRVNRDTLDGVPFSEEWDFTRDYLDLEKLRLDERLIVETDFDEQALNCFVPVFLLQPIIENSIRYAISPRETGGKIWVSAKCKDNSLFISIKDDGSEVTETVSDESSGIALQITRDRLIKYYGKEITFKADRETDQGFVVQIKVPIIEEPI